ncbi:LamG-like jellyroll fold domain-containing protein [Haloferula sp. BvORR071]|uniref:LamG-like jellyroll fold domain-containing protein n=1 Tax=Haloferula sp. BvORR071 TaxID=1396141 RepID=UPI00055456B9|nr:LamG-like jellyroll fold domain-containing protein [Haloferula sp. BvORR071]
MSLRRSIPRRRLEQVLQDLEDGALSAEDHWWLMSQLRESPEVRRAYREHMAFAAALHGSAEAWAPEHDYEEKVFQIPPPPLWQRLPRKAIYAAAALIALLAVAASFLAIRSSRLPPVKVTAGAETLWEYTSGGIGRDGEFLPGTRLLVDRGSLEIVTRTRTRMFVEGPATLEITDPAQVSLSSGKAWFESPDGSQDLTVNTERLRANGAGARFGVAVSTAGDRIQVEAGNLRVESKSPGIPVTTLGPGQAATSDLVGRSKPAPVDPGLFLDELSREPAYIHWTFDEESSGGFPAKSAGIEAAPIRITGVKGKAVTPQLTPGAFGSGLDLTGGDCFAESDFPGISGSGPRSVALWIKGRPIPRRVNAKRVDYTPSVVMWGDQSINGGSWTFRAHCVTGIIGTQWGSNGLLTAGKIGTMSVLDGQWHHIASVFTGEVTETGEVEVRHYIDGQRVFTTTAAMDIGVDTRLGSEPANRLRVACDNQMPDGPGNVPVSVDELFIFRSALSDEQIKTLYQENRFMLRE